MAVVAADHRRVKFVSLGLNIWPLLVIAELNEYKNLTICLSLQ